MTIFNYNFYFVFLIFLNLLLENRCYIIPIPNFELSRSNTILVSIPDKDGLEWAIFHGAVNRKIKTHETGDFSTQLLKNGKDEWTTELRYNFNKSDVLYYWIYAQFDGASFWQPDHHYNLKILFQKSIEDENIILLPENCTETITNITGSNRQLCKGFLIFDETFDIYNSTKWQREIKFNGFDGEFVIYEDRPQNLYVNNGNLHIIPTLTSNYRKIIGVNVELDKCTEEIQTDYFCRRNAQFRILPPITSAKIRTKKSFSFRYGRVDVRAKLPKGDWIFPQILLEPLNNTYAVYQDHEYLDGQMRIAFIQCNEATGTTLSSNGSILSGGVIFHHVNNVFMAKTEQREHLGNEFHVYSLLWTDKNIKLYIDNKLYGTIQTSIATKIPKDEVIKVYKDMDIERTITYSNMEPFFEPFYISLGVGVGGSNFPDSINTINTQKPWENDDPKAETTFLRDYNKWIKTWKNNNEQLIVDYVKVWAV